jgi:uncharacterized protein YwgA
MKPPMNQTLRVAQLLRVLQKVEGRKKLHKEVHILQELGCPFPERFAYSYYGMYSQELRAEVDSLIKDKLLEEEANPNMANEFTYTVKSTPALEQFLGGLKIEKGPAWAPLAKDLNSLHVQVLEGVSTILFLLHRGLDAEDLKKRFHALKPHLANIYAQCEQRAKALIQTQSNHRAA